MAFAAFSVLAQSRANHLSGTAWRLVEFKASDGSTITPDDRSKYTMSFGAEGSVSMRVDCNRGRGTWRSSGSNQLELGPLALTRAMCPPGPLNDRLPGDFENVRWYALKNQHLYLSLTADRGTYEFEPLRSAAGLDSQSAASAQHAGSDRHTAASLEDTQWKLTRLGGRPLSTAGRQAQPYLVLSHASHRVSGSGGCNRLMGSYELDGSRLKFGHMASTMMYCPDGMETEKTFQKALAAVRTWKISGQTLELYDAKGRLLAALEAR